MKPPHNQNVSLEQLLSDAYAETLRRCDPHRLTGAALRELDMHGAVNVVALGKCAAPMIDAALELLDVRRAFAGVPEGYPLPSPNENLLVARGSHPRVTRQSIEAGGRLLQFVRDSDLPLLFLVSGGSSAAIDFPQPPITPGELMDVQEELLRAPFSIDELNTVRKHLSAIKGGRLALAARQPFATLVLSDVDPARPEIVGSGPTVADRSSVTDAATLLERLGGATARRLVHLLERGAISETPKYIRGRFKVAADNALLRRTAAECLREHDITVTECDEQIDGPVAAAAAALLDRVSRLASGEALVAGGEPVVAVRGSGRGGRCSELAAAMFLEHRRRQSGSQIVALLGSSDGVDGSSGVAAVWLDTARCSADPTLPERVTEAIRQSDTISVAEAVGGAIRIPPTGNNLRDIFLLARR